MIRALVVEDSSAQRVLLTGLLQTDPTIEVAGAVASGTEALAFLAQQKVDVVTMDLRLPDMNGLEVTRRIMETHPVPVVIVSDYWDAEGADLTFRAMEAGAVTGVNKPMALDAIGGEELAQQFLLTVKLMSEVRVIRRWPRTRRSHNLALPLTRTTLSRHTATTTSASVLASPQSTRTIDLLVIGASTGGPPVLRTILAGLPKTFPAPILVVQHIAKGFSPSLVQWLQQESLLPFMWLNKGRSPLLATCTSLPTESIWELR